MALNFTNASVLSYNSSNQFFGDDVIRYRTVKNLEIEGVSTFITSSGISGAISGIQALELSSTDWQVFSINGINLGSGIINSIDFNTPNPVRRQDYAISITIYDSGSINNFPLNGAYSGVDFTQYQFVDSLDESISLDRDFEKDIYNHSVNVKVLSSNYSGSIKAAKNIAKNLFENVNGFQGYLGSYYNLSGKKAVYEERYDQISAATSFNKKIEFFSNSSGNYTVNKNYSYNRDEDGGVTVSEQGNIIALATDYLNILSSAYAFESASTYNNCLSVFTAYKESSNQTLKLVPITKGNSINRFERTLDYEWVYTDNEGFVGNSYFWEYNNSSDLSEDGLITVSTEGRIVGADHRVDNKYAKALSGLSSVLSNAQSLVNTSYTNFKNFLQLNNSNLFVNPIVLIAKRQSHSRHLGVISYSQNYSNDQTLITTDSKITKQDISLTEGYSVPISQSFNILNYKEIEQVSSNYEVAEKTLTINLRGKRNTTVNEFLAYAKNLALNYTGGTSYINSAAYSFNPFSNSFVLTISFAKIIEP